MNWLSLTISNVLTASQPPSAQTREDSSHSGTQLLAQSGNAYQAWSTSCSTDQVKFYRNCWLMVECQHCIWDDGDPLKSKSRRTYCTKDQVLKCHRSIDCLESRLHLLIARHSYLQWFLRLLELLCDWDGFRGWCQERLFPTGSSTLMTCNWVHSLLFVTAYESNVLATLTSTRSFPLWGLYR